MKIILVLLIVLSILVGCYGKTVIPMSEMSFDPLTNNRIVCIEEVGNTKPVFELYGDGVIRVRRDLFQDDMESGKLSQRQIKRMLNHIINVLRIGDLGSSYPEEFIPGIEMYPNPELMLEVNINGFYKQIYFAYSSVCDELEYFKKEGRIDEETFRELNKLRAVFNYLIEINIDVKNLL